MPAPCVWCDRDVMEHLASFNGGDICVDCEEDYLDELAEEEEDE